MNEIKVFEKEEFGKVRTVVIDNTVWFVGKDVAEILAYKDTADAIKKHVDDEDKRHVKVGEIPTLKTSNYGAYLINESGVYSLVFSSKLPAAKEFKHWVTKEVIPSIRKTGSYSVQKMSNEDLMAIIVQTNNQIANICASMNEQLKITTNQTQENTARIEKLEKDVKKVFDQNYGEVNAYHISVWESLYFDALNYE